MPVLTGVEDDIVLHGKKSRSSCNEPVADHSICLWASEQTILSASCFVDEAEPPRRALMSFAAAQIVEQKQEDVHPGFSVTPD